MMPSEIDSAISALEAALASGELTVEYAGRRTTYQSQDNIIKALEYFKRQKQGVPTTGPAPASADRGSYASFSRD
ncbi:phage head-tail joining protein [Methylocystis rosea]|uniref:phage head-tail joining protein n=1 Tax=Methylocystis rosea TaxID=173366 RepID=UPI00037CE54D|nr:hypothetical protein [Methylocystis rosea]